MPRPDALSTETLPARLRAWARELGFAEAAVSAVALDEDQRHLRDWLTQGFHGAMAYMQRTEGVRGAPAALRPGTVTVISARMDFTPDAAPAEAVLADGTRGYIARYALGRDYHRLLRARLKRLGERLRREIAPFGYRVLADSAPALEKALARDAGLGWIGKHTLLLDRSAGSSFLLGEIYCDLPLPATAARAASHCGSCTACLDVCPTRAIVAPYRLDARRCISYLTIESRDAIPPEFRRALGNRIFGCDDCQLVCPWNKYARRSDENDFAVRHGLDAPRLLDLFRWSEADYLAKTEGMALRRTGYEGWQRNLAVALGNAPPAPEIVAVLAERAGRASPLVREHIEWAIREQQAKAGPEAAAL